MSEDSSDMDFEEDDSLFGEDEYLDRIEFADPGGRSALRAESPTNPRNLPCSACGQKNVLTPADVALGYICDDCADAIDCFGGYY